MEHMSTNLAIIFDFDGTMVNLFACYDLTRTTKSLSLALEKYGIHFDCRLDPFDIFTEISKHILPGNKRETAYLEAHAILTQAELEAVKTCEPLCGMEEVFPRLCAQYRVGIATNNSEECVRHFLSRHFPELDLPIVGRVGTAPERMKPNSWPLKTAAKQMGSHPDNIVFIGDTSTDQLCAQRAGCAFLGIAPSPSKHEYMLNFLPKNHIAENYYEIPRKIELFTERPVAFRRKSASRP